MNRARQGKVVMYQVFVTDTNLGHEIPIGPRVDVKDALLGFVERTNTAVATGQIHGWKDAYIKTLDPSEAGGLIV
jgi:hypothetical protein